MILSIQKIKTNFLVLFLITAVCFLAYFNSLGNPFIWDDDALVVKNTLIRSVQNIPLSFTNDLYFGVAIGSNFWRPLQTISYIFDYHLWQLNPFGYHLTNILLQVGVSFLVFLLLISLSINFSISFACALLFAASPIHTESVTYISGRAEMLMGIFVIASLLCFISSQKEGARRPILFYVFSLFSFILALLSKEAAVVYPFIICGYIFYFLHDRLKEKYYFLRNIAPFAAIAVIYLFLRVYLFNFVTLRPPSLTSVVWFKRLIALPEILFTYLKLLILPVGLHMSRQLIRPESILTIFSATLTLGFVIFICLRYLKYSSNNKVFSFMLFWSVVFFIPQSGIFPINAFIAEHFIYLPSVSFYLLIAYVLYSFLRKKLFIFTIGLFCVFYILLTAGRNFEWRNPVVFYKSIMKYSPNSFQAHSNLGVQYEYLGRFSEAEAEYRRALKIKPDLMEARLSLANLYFKQKLYARAKLEYELLENTPLGVKAGEVENNLGNIYEAMGDMQAAVAKYTQALRLDPNLKFTHFNLARIYFPKGDMELVVFHLLRSLGESGDEADPLKRKLVADFIKNTSFVDNAAEFYNNLGINLAKSNYWQSAINSFHCASELSADSADYHYNLALAYLNVQERAKSKGALKQALRINPNHIRAKSLMAKINIKN
ncbi:MAG: tetratricopeptide repeat protein [Candidatus Omnitrophica bacterium]|nr:tetratricopeptide repeat protein [Candidatus Omnitrophota bacterium]MDD5660291.1 tetratricopeptide repeat protein [Candidatus Omnitrophota bacterium]